MRKKKASSPAQTTYDEASIRKERGEKKGQSEQ